VARYSEGVLVGYRWFDMRRTAPAFPFGHGLSYTRFRLGCMRVRAARRGIGAQVSVLVANVGRRAGVAVPQLYLGLPGRRGRVQPPRQLKGFESVALERRARTRVSFTLGRRAFSYWDARRGRWAVARGCYPLELGSSSRRISARATIAIGAAACPGELTVRVPRAGS
jgi:beta-glucosidase